MSEAVVERLIREVNQGLRVAVRMGRKGNSYLKKKFAGLLKTAQTVPVLLLTDLDRIDCPPSLINSWRGKNVLPEGLLFFYRSTIQDLRFFRRRPFVMCTRQNIFFPHGIRPGMGGRRLFNTLLTGILLLCSAILFAGPVFLHAEELKVVVLTDASGLGDHGFNDVCWQGVQRAKTDFGLNAQFLQSREQADYVANLSMAARNSEVVVTLGFLFTDAVKQVAPKVLDRLFIHIEGEIIGRNVASFDFKSEEGGFLGGLVAGLFTKARKIGVVSGMDIPPVEAYISGFKAGVKTAERERGEEIEVIVASAGSFDDPVKGRSLAQTLINQGVDVLFRVAGNTGVGVTEAVKNNEGVYLIAEDLDQDADLPGRILTSTLKRMDVAVYETLRRIIKGGFKGGHSWLGAADKAVDITDMKYSRKLFTADDMNRIEKARSILKNGELVVPRYYRELTNFAPAALTAR